MSRPEGLYVMNACNSFDVDSHKDFTLGNDYYINNLGTFYDDKQNLRNSEDFSWKKIKGLDYAEEVTVKIKVTPIEKASLSDFDDALENGVDTPKVKVVYHDEEIVSQADFNKAMQRVATAGVNLGTHVHQAPDVDPDGVTGPAEPGMVYAGRKHENPIEYQEPETNPKKARGDAKAPYVFCPETPIILLNAVMAGGAHKYGPYNFRESKVDAQTYIGGIRRHLALWADGQDKDEESNINHLAHIMANCAILIDTHSSGMMVDNRPKTGLVADILKMVADNHTEYMAENKAHDA